jgi:hypothetical protein
MNLGIKRAIDKIVGREVKGTVERAVQEVIDKELDGILDTIIAKTINAYRDHAIGVQEKMIKAFDVAIASNDMEEVKRVTDIFRDFEYLKGDKIK